MASVRASHLSSSEAGSGRQADSRLHRKCAAGAAGAAAATRSKAAPRRQVRDRTAAEDRLRILAPL